MYRAYDLVRIRGLSQTLSLVPLPNRVKISLALSADMVHDRIVNEAKYIIRGYCSDSDGGYDDESSADTLKEAKQRARYMMSEEHTRIVESTVRVAYVEIINAKTDEIVATVGQPV